MLEFKPRALFQKARDTSSGSQSNATILPSIKPLLKRRNPSEG